MKLSLYLVVFASKHLYTHNGEDKPQDETDEEYVENTWNGLNKRINDHLFDELRITNKMMLLLVL